ncbi:unnamed protein product [Darwinula stevensoni]|uniref:phospholipase A2 n=1 Tax=Darwinula stevensoni TaxID=69355 RepID=A0A7R9FRA6_9CRUS|nr:unnamed protein product [Darwinula stevensoni]CAG0900955.1 unnamed protein product [Darwinula stevensoni]
MSLIRSVLGWIRDDSSLPNTVKEANAADYAKFPIHLREENLMVYGPQKGLYEIAVLKPPNSSSSIQVFSILRTHNLKEAEEEFYSLHDKLPLLLNCSKDIWNAGMLQKVLDVLRDHPNWTVAHALAGKNSPLINHVNDEGNTPLHLACLADKPDCVQALICAGANMNAMGCGPLPINSALEGSNGNSAKEILTTYPNQLHANDMKYGGTPLHWAKSRKMVEALVNLGCCIDATNFQGDTALHVMVQRARVECVMTLLSLGANVNAKDQFGNTPLHVACANPNIPIIQALVVFGSDLKAVNEAGQLPRHLLATGGTVNQERKKALYVLHAVGAPRCPPIQTECTDSCSAAGQYNGDWKFPGMSLSPVEDPSQGQPDQKDQAGSDHALCERQRDAFDKALDGIFLERRKEKNASEKNGKPVRVLCLDGGGIKGLMLCQVLIFIEEMLGRPIATAFDWIAGTSTGGILALMIASAIITLGKSVREAQRLYLNLKDKVFVGKIRPYPTENLERFLRDEFGESTVMTDLKNHKVVLTAAMSDRLPSDLYLFRNYPPPQEILGIPEVGPFKPFPKPEEQSVWKAARATGAAPTYFRASERFMDGGIISNNPTLDLLTEMNEWNAVMEAVKRKEDIVTPTVVVSLGTGRMFPSEVSVDKKLVVLSQPLDIHWPDSPLGAARAGLGLIQFLKFLADQLTNADNRVVDRARAWCSTMGVPYFRLNPPLYTWINLDETQDEVLANSMWETMCYIHKNHKLVEELVPYLKLPRITMQDEKPLLTFARSSQVIGVSQDAEMENIIVTTLGNHVALYNAETASLVETWQPSLSRSSGRSAYELPVIYALDIESYVAFSAPNTLWVWDKESKMRRMRSHRVTGEIHRTFVAGGRGWVIYTNGSVETIAVSLSSHPERKVSQVLPSKSMIQEFHLRILPDGAAFLDITFSPRTNPELLEWRGVKLNLSSYNKEEEFHKLVRAKNKEKPMAHIFLEIIPQVTSLISIFSDGTVKKESWNRPAVEWSGLLKAAFRLSSPVALAALGHLVGHMAIFGEDTDGEGASLQVWDVRNGVCILKHQVKMYASPPRLWSIGPHLLFPVAQSMVRVSVAHLTPESLADALILSNSGKRSSSPRGKKRSLIITWDAENCEERMDQDEDDNEQNLSLDVCVSKRDSKGLKEILMKTPEISEVELVAIVQLCLRNCGPSDQDSNWQDLLNVATRTPFDVPKLTRALQRLTDQEAAILCAFLADNFCVEGVHYIEWCKCLLDAQVCSLLSSPQNTIDVLKKLRTHLFEMEQQLEALGELGQTVLKVKQVPESNPQEDEVLENPEYTVEQIPLL